MSNRDLSTVPAADFRVPEPTQSTREIRPVVFWAAWALLTAAYLAAALMYISQLPLLDPDEPRYAGAGRTMAAGGSLLVPEFNGQARINKPPLFYWLVALSDTLAGGATEASSRAPSVIMGLLMLWGTICIGKRVFGGATGLLAGLVLASTPLFMALSRCCITDMTLATCMSATLGILMLGMIDPEPVKKSGWVASFFLGLAILTKATAAFALLLVLAVERAMSLPKEHRPAAARRLPWMLVTALLFSAAAMQCEALGKSKQISKQSQTAAVAANGAEDAREESEPAPAKRNTWSLLDSVLKKGALAISLCAVALILVMAYRAERIAPALPLAWKFGLLLSIAMGLWWYVMLIAVQGWERFSALLSFELVGRFSGNVHPEGMHYYLFLLPAVTFPWSPGLFAALATACSGLPRRDPTDVLEMRRRRADRFLAAWLMGIVFFFSIPGAKLPTYVLPAMPAIALLIARFLIKTKDAIEPAARIWMRVTLAIALIAALVLALFPMYARWLPHSAPAFLSDHAPLLWAASTGSGILILGSWVLAARGKGVVAALLLGGGTLASVLVTSPHIVDLLKQRSTKQISLQVRDSIADCRIKTMGVPAEGLSYYLNKPVTAVPWKRPAPHTTGMDQLNKLFDSEAQTAVFLERRIVPRIFGGETELGGLTVKELRKHIPRQFVYVYSDASVLVLRSRPK